jgi:hypothetical protein
MPPETRTGRENHVTFVRRPLTREHPSRDSHLPPPLKPPEDDNNHDPEPDDWRRQIVFDALIVISTLASLVIVNELVDFTKNTLSEDSYSQLKSLGNAAVLVGGITTVVRLQSKR